MVDHPPFSSMPASENSLSVFNEAFERNIEHYVEEWKEFLSFPSISTDPLHDPDCTACASWLMDHVQKMGFDSRLLPTTGKPVVFAERKGKSGKPVVLFYGHYDVQPVDPLEEWITDPFKPIMRNGRLYARGAEDNKGQIFYVLKALETLIQKNLLDATVKLIIEGEEESGSRGISIALQEWKEILQADLLMVTDTGTTGSGNPAITVGLRGLVNLSISLSGPLHDLHSGVHGGLAPNPATAMARLIATLFNPDGSIAINGFYDNVISPTVEERALVNTPPFDPVGYEEESGVAPSAGEHNFTPAERLGFRPSIDVNGIVSGYSGPGVKTIIPAQAIAKMTVRLVPDQDPETCLNALIEHLERHAPRELQFRVLEKGVGGPAFRAGIHSPMIQKAKRILDELSGVKAIFRWEGASIPVVSSLVKTSGAEALLVGFGMEADRIHAPNESFSLDQFKSGYLYAARLLADL